MNVKYNTISYAGLKMYPSLKKWKLFLYTVTKISIILNTPEIWTNKSHSVTVKPINNHKALTHTGVWFG